MNSMKTVIMFFHLVTNARFSSLGCRVERGKCGSYIIEDSVVDLLR